MRIFFRKVNLVFIFLVFFSILTRFLFLNDVPFRVDGDASRIALDSQAVWQEKIPVFSIGWPGYQNFLFYLNGIFLWAFRGSLFGGRFFSALGGFLAIITTYFLAKKMFNPRIGFLSAYFLCFLPVHLVFSRNGTDMVQTTWLLPLILYLVLLGVEGNIFFLFIGGLALGFSQYFYLGIRLAPMVVFFSFLVSVYKKQPFRKVIVGVFLLVFFSILVYLPMIHYYFKHPRAIYSRIEQVGLLQTYQWEEKSKTEFLIQVLGRQFLDSFEVFFTEVKGVSWHYFGKRLLPLSGSFFLAIGLLLSFTKIFFKVKIFPETLTRPKSLILNFWFVAGIIFAGVLTVGLPQASRYMIILPAVTIFMAIGADYFFSLIKKIKGKVIFAVFLLIYGVSGTINYWHHETVDSFKYDANTQIATYAGRYLSKRKGNFRIFFLGNENMYYRASPSLEFLIKKPGTDISGPIDKSKIKFVDNDVLIILSSRTKDLLSLEKKYPDGKVVKFNDRSEKILFYLFEI